MVIELPIAEFTEIPEIPYSAIRFHSFPFIQFSICVSELVLALLR